jgi:hypothetical protein
MKKKFSSGDAGDGDAGDAASRGEKWKRCRMWSGDAASPDGYASPGRLLDPKNEKKNFHQEMLEMEMREIRHLLIRWHIWHLQHLPWHLQHLRFPGYVTLLDLQQTHRKTDRQLTQMMFVQSFTLCSTTTAYSIFALYKALAVNTKENALDLAKDNSIANILSFISVTDPCMSFYQFILSRQFFRR